MQREPGRRMAPETLEAYDFTVPKSPPEKQVFLTNPMMPSAMIFNRRAPLTLCFQCLNCYRVYEGPDCEQKALDCCGSFTQGFYKNYRRWGVQKWYGR